MSTIAAARADNFYYPPEWDPSKGGLNKFQNSHPLGVRAKKLGQGILVIRFEVPFPIWCGGCGRHIDKGVRYNAEKKQIGSYFSTKIWEFRMRCHLCPNYIVVHTDPKNADYIIFSGARKKVTEYSAKDAETIELLDEKEKEKIASDPMYRLEHGEESKEKVKKEQPRLVAIYNINERYKDDYGLSQKLRKKLRTAKKETVEIENENRRRGFKTGFQILPISEQDKAAASELLYAPVISADANTQQQRLRIKTESILPSQSNLSQSAEKLEQKIEIMSKKIYRNIPQSLRLVANEKTTETRVVLQKDIGKNFKIQLRTKPLRVSKNSRKRKKVNQDSNESSIS